MTTPVPPLEYPAIGIIENGLTHAARPGVVPEHGWGRAMCSKTLYVSIEHTVLPFHEGDRFVFRTVPLRATSDPAPTVDPEKGVVAEGVDCLKCSRAVARWEGEQAAGELERRILLELAAQQYPSAAELATALDVDEARVEAVMHTRLLRRRLARRAPWVIDDRRTYGLTPTGLARARELRDATDHEGTS